MVENGEISVTCEFCSANYKFAPEEVGAAPDGANRTERDSAIMTPSAHRAAAMLAAVAVPVRSSVAGAQSQFSSVLPGAARRRPPPGAGDGRKP